MTNTLIKEFIKDKYVGALFPTSQYVIKELCSRIDFAKADVILEYGPGNGVITSELLKKMKPNARLFAIETNEDFITVLNNFQDKRLTVISGSAGDTNELLSGYKVAAVDVVLSGIPFTFFKPEVRNQIVFQTQQLLKTGGKFIMYQHSGLMKKYLKAVFGNAKLSIVWRSIPPMFVLEAVK